ncbi:MAG: ABC transporter substrate-binding protein [Candidatus Bathyarchaeota archaeon]|nr:ABC transporter substrate-binding protein [Candidatus Bathyarchaeota archaeon]
MMETRFLAVIIICLLIGGSVGYLGSNIINDSKTADHLIVDELTRTRAELANQTMALNTLRAQNAELKDSFRMLSDHILVNKTVKIGYIAPESTTFAVTKPYIEKVIQPDLNAYASSLGMNVTFEFVMLDANGQANAHLERVQDLHNEGIDIFIGAGWSSMCCASLSYENAHHMLAISPSSTSPSCAIANDSMFRMCPADSALAPALADIIWSYGVKEVVIIQRGDSYADGIVYEFTPKFVALGGVVSQPIRYEALSDVEMANVDYCTYLQTGRDRAQVAIARMGGDSSRVCVLLIAYNEAARIIKQASQCDVLYNLVWFGADGTARNGLVIGSSPLEANHLKLFSSLAQQPASTKYSVLGARYAEATGGIFNIYQAYLYDAAFVLAKTIIETGSTNATNVAAALPGVCENTYGVSGWCRLNEYGDRSPQPFDIWYYAPGVVVPSEASVAGVYNPDTGVTLWNRTPDFTVLGP